MEILKLLSLRKFREEREELNRTGGEKRGFERRGEESGHDKSGLELMKKRSRADRTRYAD